MDAMLAILLSALGLGPASPEPVEPLNAEPESVGSEADTAAAAPAVDGLAALPAELLHRVLALAASGDMASLWRLRAVSSAVRTVVDAGPWPEFDRLVARPTPHADAAAAPLTAALAWAALHAPKLASLDIEGAALATQALAPLAGMPLSTLRLVGLRFLHRGPPAALACLASPWLQSLDLTASHPSCPQTVAALRAAPRTSSLTIDAVPWTGAESAAVLAVLATACPNLARLSARFCTAFTPGAPAVAADSAIAACACLESLTLAGCGGLGGPETLGLLGRLRCLTDLDLSDTATGDGGIAAWAATRRRPGASVSETDTGTLPESETDAGVTLMSLSLAGCERLTDVGLESLRPWCPRLTTLTIRGALRVSDAAIAPLMSSLTSLDAGGCGGVGGPRFFESLAAVGGATLVKLSLGGAVGLSQGMMAAAAAGGRLSRLAALDVSGCPALRRDASSSRDGPTSRDDSSSDGLAAAVAAAPRLAAFAADGLEISGPLLAALCTLGHGLESLSLVGATGLTPGRLGMLAGALSGLKSLAVGGGGPGGCLAADLAAFVASCTGLIALRFSRCSTLGDGELAAAVAANPGLESVTLAACGGVTDHGLESMASGAAGRRLKRLSLVACDHPRLTGAPLRRFAGLESLAITSCPHVTAEAVGAAAALCGGLLTLGLPTTLPRSCVPIQDPSLYGRLGGLLVTGGGVRGIDCAPAAARGGGGDGSGRSRRVGVRR